MATLTVGTSGADYTTIAAAIAAAGAADIVRLITDITEDVNLNKNIAGIESDSPTARRTWTSAGSWVALEINSGINQAMYIKDLIITRTSGDYEVVRVSTVGVSTAIAFSNTRFTSVGVAADIFGIFNSNTANAFTFDRCEFIGDGTNTQDGLDLDSGSNAVPVCTITNSIFRGFNGGSTASGVESDQNTSSNKVNVYNCTFDGNLQGIQTNSRLTCTNCVFTNNTNDIAVYNSGLKSDWTHCAFEEDDGTGLGTGCITGLTSSNEYVDEANNDYHLKAGASCRDAGVTIGAVTVDFDNVARPQGSAYCIGAFEFVSSGLPPGNRMMMGIGT